MLIIIGVIVWYLLGLCCFIYWWTQAHDYTGDDITTSLVIACLGPTAFIFGWYVFGKDTSDRIILKKRL